MAFSGLFFMVIQYPHLTLLIANKSNYLFAHKHVNIEGRYFYEHKLKNKMIHYQTNPRRYQNKFSNMEIVS